jgi:cell division protein ZapE
MAVLDAYRALVAGGTCRPDPAQESAVRALDDLGQRLKRHERSRRSLLGRFKLGSEADGPRGLYLFGGVGRGKSMLMDLFHMHAATPHKKRVHFHAFMLDVHARIFAWRKDPANKVADGDPIKPVAKQLAAEASLLSFDEFQVTDTADAMILQRLFKKMFERGVVVVATSNRPPDDLYKGGLNRELFVPFIETLKTRCEVLQLDGGRDYRLERLRMAPVYHPSLDQISADALGQAFRRLAGVEDAGPATLDVQGRQLTIPRAANGVAYATFEELCERPLGPADYLEIAQTFNTLILAGIPVMAREKRNEAKRFVTLIDALYEHRVKLVCSAAAKPDGLYPHGDGSFEFTRCASRLMEMQSEDYLGTAHT